MNVQTLATLLHHQLALIRDKCETHETEHFRLGMNINGHDPLNEQNVMTMLLGQYMEICSVLDEHRPPHSTIKLDLNTLERLRNNGIRASVNCEWPLVSDAIDDLYWQLHQHKLVPSGANYDKEVFKKILDAITVTTDLDVWIPAIYYTSMNVKLLNLYREEQVFKNYELSITTLNDLVHTNLPKYKGQIKDLTCCGRLDETLGLEKLLRMRCAALMVLSKITRRSQETSQGAILP